jgi:hypothetical protein
VHLRPGARGGGTRGSLALDVLLQAGRDGGHRAEDVARACLWCVEFGKRRNFRFGLFYGTWSPRAVITTRGARLGMTRGRAERSRGGRRSRARWARVFRSGVHTVR